MTRFYLAWMVSLGCVTPHGSAPHGSVSHDRHDLAQLAPVPGRRIAREERWLLSHPDAIAKLADTAFGEREIDEFWRRKGWRMTKREEQYLAEVAALEQRGVLTAVTQWHTCPFATVYQTLDRATVLGIVIERGHELVLDFDDDDDHLQLGEPRFTRTSSYGEDHEEGHGPAGIR